MWTLELPGDAAVAARVLAAGQVLAIDIDPRGPGVVVAPREPGLGDASVGQRVVFRQWLGAGGDDEVTAAELTEVFSAVRAWMESPHAGQLLSQVSEGYRMTRLWSGDELGDWTPEAWAAAGAVVAGVVGAMEATEAAT